MARILTFTTTLLYPPPHPPRSRDWMACYEDDKGDEAGRMAVGYGATEQAAIDELKAKFPREGNNA